MKWEGGGGGSTINAGGKLMIYSRSCKTNRSIINLVKNYIRMGITKDACKVEKKYIPRVEFTNVLSFLGLMINGIACVFEKYNVACIGRKTN